MNPKVNAYFDRATQWQDELRQLRAIALGCGLTEELKWYAPCYTFEQGNIVIIQSFKAYCALLFFKGALLSNSDGVLVKTGENTKVGRQIRFTGSVEIAALEPIVKAAIQDAIEVQKTGRKVVAEEGGPLELPEEFERKLEERPDLKSAFFALTPGRRRAYSLHFSAPKQSKTRESRVEQSIPHILAGKGLNDRSFR